MNKGKIALSLCTSLLCVTALAGCNGGTKGATWSSVLEFLDGIYTNIGGWEAINIECDSEYNYPETTYETVTQYVPGIGEIVTTQWSYERIGTENYKANFRDKDGYLYGSVTYFYEGLGFNDAYHVDNEYEYYANRVFYNKWNYKYEDGEVDGTDIDYDNSTYEEINSEVKTLIRDYISTYGTNVSQNYISGAKLGKRKAEWTYSDSKNTVKISIEVNNDLVLDYFSLDGDFADSDGTTKRNLVIKEINSSKVKKPSWFKSYEYEWDF